MRLWLHFLFHRQHHDSLLPVTFRTGTLILTIIRRIWTGTIRATITTSMAGVLTIPLPAGEGQGEGVR